ncbi:MAG: hypothetical protein Q4B43_05895, partial [Bacteroidota bacterium]|nr:hypothetical protein [Bacteroidota bacterium]
KYNPKTRPKQRHKLFKVKESILKLLKEDKRAIPHLYLETDVPMSTLKRWIEDNDEKLTMYVILYVISQYTGKEIKELLVLYV